jgi:hypothetical protein
MVKASSLSTGGTIVTEHLLPILSALGTLFGGIGVLGGLLVGFINAKKFHRITMWFANHMALVKANDELEHTLLQVRSDLKISDERASRLDASVRAGSYLKDQLDDVTANQAKDHALIVDWANHYKLVIEFISRQTQLLVANKIEITETCPELPESLRREFSL